MLKDDDVPALLAIDQVVQGPIEADCVFVASGVHDNAQRQLLRELL